MAGETLEGIYKRTLNNCRFYEERKETKKLLNEIGVLRGISYACELAGICPHNEDLEHFISIQNELLK